MLKVLSLKRLWTFKGYLVPSPSKIGFSLLFWVGKGVDKLEVKNTAKRNMSSAVCLPAMCKSFRQKSSSVKVRLPSKVIFRQKSSSVKGHLPSKVVFRQRSSSVKGHLSSKVVFHQKLSSVKGCLPPKVVLPQR